MPQEGSGDKEVMSFSLWLGPLPSLWTCSMNHLISAHITAFSSLHPLPAPPTPFRPPISPKHQVVQLPVLFGHPERNEWLCGAERADRREHDDEHLHRSHKVPAGAQAGTKDGELAMAGHAGSGSFAGVGRSKRKRFSMVLLEKWCVWDQA